MEHLLISAFNILDIGTYTWGHPKHWITSERRHEEFVLVLVEMRRTTLSATRTPGWLMSLIWNTLALLAARWTRLRDSKSRAAAAAVDFLQAITRSEYEMVNDTRAKMRDAPGASQVTSTRKSLAAWRKCQLQARLEFVIFFSEMRT